MRKLSHKKVKQLVNIIQLLGGLVSIFFKNHCHLSYNLTYCLLFDSNSCWYVSFPGKYLMEYYFCIHIPSSPHTSGNF